MLNSTTTRRNRKTVLGRGCLLPLVVVAAFAFFWLLASIFGWFGAATHIPIYANAQPAELTAKGNALVDSFYKDNKREGSTIKVLLSTDKPEDIIKFYQNEFNKQQFEAIPERLEAIPNAYTFDFETKSAAYVVAVSSDDDGLVANQKPGDTYIIVAQGNPAT